MRNFPKLHHLVIENPAWFTSEIFPGNPYFLKKFFIGIHRWSLRRIERDSLEDVQALQLRRLRRLIKHAYNTVPFWHDWMDGSGVKPEDINSFQDLSNIPSVTKKVLNSVSQEELVSSKATASHYRIVTTTGTTGVPLKIFYDNLTEERYAAMKLRVSDWNLEKKNKDDLYIRVGRSNNFFDGFTAFVALDFPFLNFVKSQLYQLCGKRKCVLYSYPSYLIYLAKLIKSEKIDMPLKGIMTSAESLNSEEFALLKEIFKCPIGERYGTTEVGTIAQTCSAGKYHINIDQCVVEVITRDGIITPADISGKLFGRVVVTDLNNYVMPFIRYEVGDISILSQEECGCGKLFPVIHFEGRDIAVAKFSDGRILHSFNLLWPLARRPDWISRYQVIRNLPDQFTVLVVPRNKYLNSDISELQEELLEILKFEAGVEIKIVPEIETRGSNKFRPFISLVPGDAESMAFRDYKLENIQHLRSH